MTKLSPFHLYFFNGGMKPKKHHSKNNRRQRNKVPLTRKQRMRQQFKERMLQARAAIVEVCVVADEPRDISASFY